MVDVAFAPPTAAHVEELHRTMRLADRDECLAIGLSGRDAVRESLARATHASTVLFGGEVAAILGVRDTDEGRLAWVLTAAPVTRYPLTFWRLCRPTLAVMRGDASRLFNWVDARYVVALRWLRHLGFTVEPAQPYGPNAALFHRCTLEG